MAKKLWTTCLILILLLSICATGFSQKESTEKSKTVYVTINDIKVRDNPPSKGIILVSGPGKEIFDLKKDAEVIILETRTISTVFNETIWVRVRDLESKKEGWMYWGEDKKSVNLKEK